MEPAEPDVRQLFADDAVARLDRMGEQLLELEHAPGQTDLLANLFREAHSLKGGAGVERAYATVRKYAAPLLEDRALAPDIAAIASAIRAGEFDSEHEKL